MFKKFLVRRKAIAPGVIIKPTAKIRPVAESVTTTVKEIIEMGWIEENKIESGQFRKNLKKVANECKIEYLLERKLNSLSGGEKRRVHFARTLIQVWNDNLQNDPSFMFLDEPTSNLDLYHELKLLKILKNE